MDFGSPQVLTASLSTLAKTTKGSDILRIAAEIRALKATGRPLCNLTIGDFDSAQFSIPEPWRAGIGQALAAGRTNYPPPDGCQRCARRFATYTRASSVSTTRSNRWW